jgi:hypothetical protein
MAKASSSLPTDAVHHNPAVAAATRAHPAPRLPFVLTRRGPGSCDSRYKSLWHVTPSGVWHQDCKLGEEYARIYLEQEQAGKLVPLLGWIVRDMIAAGRYTGIEAAFITCTRRPNPYGG